MTTQTEALKLALEALRMPCSYWNKTQFIKAQEAIKAGEEALAQPEQEPLGYMSEHDIKRLHTYKGTVWPSLNESAIHPVYTTPPQRKPLDIKTIKRIATYCGEHITDEDVIEITRRVEEEHKIKE